MERRTHRADRWLLGLAAAAGTLLLVATMVSGQSRAKAKGEPRRAPIARDSRLVYDLALMNAEGELLARPRLLGRAGQPLLLTYRNPEARAQGRSPAPDLTLGLDALVAPDGLDLALDLALDRGAPERVRLRLPLTERRTLRIPREGGDLYLAIHALAVDTPEFDSWAEGVRAAERLRRVPEA
ncbi:MAG: hypothetical protein P1V51_13080 [Deltaproteobacteria bacterium]|nr:hypothetical protein [Deltaproteobacteria bacterium]